MEVDSDSSSDSVIITGPIPEYPELRRKPARCSVSAKVAGSTKRKKRDHSVGARDNVDKILELEDFVKSTTRSGDKDEEIDDLSGSDTKSTKGIGKRDPASKYLKKIKTLQQNKRRQETRISRLTKEVRSLRDKNSIQAAYIDVLCGMLGDDMKEKFRDRQGMGILGNTKLDDDQFDMVDADRRGNGQWSHEEGAKDKVVGSDGTLKEKEREFYCVEDLDDLQENGLTRTGSSDDLKEVTCVKHDKIEEEDMGQLTISTPSTSYGITKKRTCKEATDEMGALTIAVGGPKKEPFHKVTEQKQMAGSEIHHGVFGEPYERRLCVYEGQVGESVFAQVPRETSKDSYGDMRLQLTYMKQPRTTLVPSIVPYGRLMGNHSLNILPAVHPTTDDPLNIGSEDSSSFGPLIISTALDPLNLIPHAGKAANKPTMKSHATPSDDPLNIGTEEALIQYPGSSNLPTDIDSIDQKMHDASSAEGIDVKTTTQNDSTEVPIGTETKAPLPPMDSSTEGINPTAAQDHKIPTSSAEVDMEKHLTLHSDSVLSMPLISDEVSGDSDQQDDGSGNILQPQAIEDHFINNISCNLSDLPDLQLE